jgi:hypothetical protein
MTEAEWLAAKSVLSLIDERASLGRRKLRLLAAACARRMLAAVPSDDAFEAIIAASERYADDPAARPAAVAARKPLRLAARRISPGGVSEPLKKALVILIDLTNDVLEGHTAGISNAAWVTAHPRAVKRADARAVGAYQLAVLRCIYGNPFRPVTADPVWLTPTVASLARAAYDERQLPGGELEPHRLAVLADALEEVGAPSELATHLRGPGPHVRGCFAVDLCLGKT